MKTINSEAFPLLPFILATQLLVILMHVKYPLLLQTLPFHLPPPPPPQSHSDFHPEIDAFRLPPLAIFYQFDSDELYGARGVFRLLLQPQLAAAAGVHIQHDDEEEAIGSDRSDPGDWDPNDPTENPFGLDLPDFVVADPAYSDDEPVPDWVEPEDASDRDDDSAADPDDSSADEPVPDPEDASDREDDSSADVERFEIDGDRVPESPRPELAWDPSSDDDPSSSSGDDLSFSDNDESGYSGLPIWDPSDDEKDKRSLRQKLGDLLGGFCICGAGLNKVQS